MVDCVTLYNFRSTLTHKYTHSSFGTKMAGPATAAAPAAAARRAPETSFFAKCVGDAAVVYSKSTTDRLTDLAGTFLVMCISVYFTVAGYLFYRELALSS